MGRAVDARDVDASINMICVESVAMEFNISRFIECMCKQTLSVDIDLDTDQGHVDYDLSPATDVELTKTER